MTALTQTQKAMLMTQIAVHLEGFAYFDPGDGRQARLSGRDGMGIYISEARERGKLHIHGEWPMDGRRYMSPRSWGVVPYCESEDISINVALDRGPQSIAREIIRRFLSPYAALYQKCLKARAERQDYRRGAHTTACAIAAAVGKPEPPIGQNQTEYHISLGSPCCGWYGTATAHADLVSFELRSLSPELAGRIVELLRTAGDGKEDVQAA